MKFSLSREEHQNSDHRIYFVLNIALILRKCIASGSVPSLVSHLKSTSQTLAIDGCYNGGLEGFNAVEHLLTIPRQSCRLPNCLTRADHAALSVSLHVIGELCNTCTFCSYTLL